MKSKHKEIVEEIILISREAHNEVMDDFNKSTNRIIGLCLIILVIGVLGLTQSNHRSTNIHKKSDYRTI